MESQYTKSEIISSLLWKLMERGGTQGVQFIVQIILARILSPEDYGIMALVTILILLANVFVQSGFNTALIQKKDVDEIDFSSVFYLSLSVASFLYLVLFFASPFIANFFLKPQLKHMIRVLSIILFFGAINSIQNAVISRCMQFKKLFFSSLGAITGSGIIGIAMAYANLGVWALVVQQLMNQLLVTIILWITVNWRPRLVFSYERIKGLFSYSSKLLASSLVDTIDRELRTFIIGRVSSSAILGFYNRGKQFPELIVSNINGSIQSVMLPALASQQDNSKRVKQMVRRSIVTSSFIIFPMMIGLAVVAEPLIKILLTEKWAPAVPFLRIFCMSYALWPIHTANLQAINALGRSDIFLKLEIIKKIFSLTILIISIPYGVYSMALGTAVSGIISSLINAYPNFKLLNYSYKEQLADITPSFIISALMGGAVYSIIWLRLDALTTLIIQSFIGIVLYIGLARVFKIKSLFYIITTIKEMRIKS